MDDSREVRLRIRLQAIQSRYLGKLPARLAELSELATRLCDQGLDDATLLSLRRLAHNLRGSAATFQLPTLSSCAGELEDLLPATSGKLAQSEALLDCLHRLHEAAAQLPPPASA